MIESYVCIDLVDDLCIEWMQTYNPLSLSVEDGAILATAIIACWAIAYGARIIIGFLLNR